MKGYTIVVGVTNHNYVPTTATVTQNSDGSATVEASRRTDRRHLHTALFQRFGNRAGWPFARGRRWIVKIASAPLEFQKPNQEAA